MKWSILIREHQLFIFLLVFDSYSIVHWSRSIWFVLIILYKIYSIFFYYGSRRTFVAVTTTVRFTLPPRHCFADVGGTTQEWWKSNSTCRVQWSQRRPHGPPRSSPDHHGVAWFILQKPNDAVENINQNGAWSINQPLSVRLTEWIHIVPSSCDQPENRYPLFQDKIVSRKINGQQAVYVVLMSIWFYLFRLPRSDRNVRSYCVQNDSKTSRDD